MRTNNTIRIIDTLFLCVLSLSVHAADYPMPAPPAPAQWPLEFSINAPGQPTVAALTPSETGRKEFNQMHYERAAVEFSRIPGRQRSDLDESYLAWSHYYLANPSAALEGFQKIIDRHPASVDSLVGAGWSLYALHRYDEGAAYFKMAKGINE